MRMIIDGREFIRCDRCENWNESLTLCNCIIENRKSQIRKFLESIRAKNRKLVLTMPMMFVLESNKEEVKEK